MDTINLQGPQVLLRINFQTQMALSRKDIFKALFIQSLPLLEKQLPQKAMELGLHLCGEKKIMSLNSLYRNKKKKTDVLSFPLYNSVRDLRRQNIPIINLGDIFICLPMAVRQAKKFKINLEKEVIYLFIHGFLHLLGHDHEISQGAAKKMFSLEEQLVGEIFNQTNLKESVNG